ncbi:MAG: PocR ligand-binding domain-containing protein [Desulfitobacteriaceae bacterium]
MSRHPKTSKSIGRILFSIRYPSSVIDTKANILIGVGWQDICTKFHRVNNETELLCRQSDMHLEKYQRKRLSNIEPYIYYSCPNGLIDVVAPIIIDGEHLATIFTGQFLFEEPDIEQFCKQARRYGFDEEEYLEALTKVPIFSKNKLDSAMRFFLQLADMLAEMGIAQLRLIKTQKKALQESEERLRTIINNTPNVAIQSYDKHGKILFANKASETIFGWVSEEIVGKTLDQLILDNEAADKFLEMLETIDGTENPYKLSEWTITNILGIEKHILSSIFPIHLFEGKKEFICMDIDITEKKRFEKEIIRLDQLNIIG